MNRVFARKIVLTGLIAASAILAGCDELNAKNKGLSEIRALLPIWFDEYNLAKSTPRIQITTRIANLQAHRRTLKEIQTSECVAPAKEILLTYMDEAIEGFFLFNSSKNWEATSKLSQAENTLQKFLPAADQCE